MTELAKDDALVFVESMRLTLVNRVGFRWMVERLSDLAAYIESVNSENTRLNAYLDWAGARGDYESFIATSFEPRGNVQDT